MNYSEAISFLYGLRLFGTQFGLENIFRLASICGNPQDSIQFIHVAGTNGKGSTCAILESIYRNAGFKTGFFSSPHLVSFTERIQVNREPISEAAAAELATFILAKIVAENGANPDPNSWTFRPTFFEVVTVMALLYFAQAKCDLVVWETGLGGRLDATNIVRPLASVITNVQLDHESWLGSTVAEIAREKAGIIKSGVPVISGCADPAAVEVIRETAAQKLAPLFTPPEELRAKAARIGLALKGEHQLSNAACALQVVDVLQPLLPVTEPVIAYGLKNVIWPGRLQLIHHKGREILLDGAHNPDGARTLRDAITAFFGDRKVSLVLGAFQDKAWQRMCDILVPSVDHVYLTPLQSERTANPRDLEAYCNSLNPASKIEVHASVAKALEVSLQKDSAIVVAGSLHLIGEAMEYLQVSPFTRSERSLNEWNAQRPRD